MSDQDEKSDIGPNVVDEVGLTLEITDDGQQADGSSKTTATATVTKKGNKPTDGEYEVLFQILKSDGNTAKFTDTGNQDTSGRNDENGLVIKTFYDTLAETGTIYVHIKLHNGGKPRDEQPFEFVTIDPDKITIELENNGALAGDGAYITAPVTATRNGAAFTGQATIYYQIVPDDNAAVFYDEDGQSLGKKTTAVTDAKTGITNPPPRFKGLNWETGTVQAWWDVSQEDKPPAEADYEFNTPNFRVTLYGLTTDGETVHPSGAHLTNALATFKAEGDNQHWTHGGDATFTFSSLPHVKIYPQEGVHKIYTTDGTIQYNVPIKGDGTASLTFYDETIESGLVKVSVLDPDGNVKGESAPAAFTSG